MNKKKPLMPFYLFFNFFKFVGCNFTSRCRVLYQCQSFKNFGKTLAHRYAIKPFNNIAQQVYHFVIIGKVRKDTLLSKSKSNENQLLCRPSNKNPWPFENKLRPRKFSLNSYYSILISFGINE